MKTQTSKTRIWLSSLLLLPIIAILFYNFAEKEYVEKTPLKTSEVLQISQKTDNEVADAYLMQEPPIMLILINRNNQFLVDDKIGSLESVENKLKKLAKEVNSGQLVAIKYDTETSKEIISKVEALVKAHKFKVASFNISPVMSILINRKDQILVNDELGTLKSIENELKKLVKAGEYGRLVFVKYDTETSKEIISKVEGLVTANKFKYASYDISELPPPPAPLAPKKTSGGSNASDDINKLVETQEKATLKQVKDFNAWAKEMNASENKIIKRNDLKKYKHIYNIMSAEQKKTSAAFPQIPPPPPPTKAPQYKNGNKKTLNEIIKETPKGTESGYEMLENGESHYFTTYKSKKTYFNKDGYITDDKGKILPPPPPVLEPIKSNNKTINALNINVDENYNLVLNGKIVEFENLAEFADKINSHLSNEAKRGFAHASILLPDNTYMNFSDKIKRELRKVNILSYSTGYRSNMEKSDLKPKHFNFYAGLSIKEAKARRDSIYNGDYEKKLKQNNSKKDASWDVSYKVTSVEFIPDAEENTNSEHLEKPESTLDFVIRMAKANSKFFNEGKSITSDKAIDLIKKNPKLNVNGQKTDTKQPLIYITKKPILIGEKGKS